MTEEAMGERLTGWISSFGAVAVVAAGLLSAGCGAYEPEPEYPQYQYVAPAPPTAAELAAQQQAREQAVAESREILIGADGDEYSDTDPSALTEFKPVLENHGTWIDDATYGTVWVPSRGEVSDDFQPYVTAGHWTYSESTDYVWVSDYSWGWAPFHYGRWVHLPGHGWAWIPGRRYAGAWVTWRVGPAGYGYVGWAPAPPSWYWYQGVAYGWSYGWYDHHHHYVYCSRTYVYDRSVSTHVVRGAGASEHHGRTQDYIPARPAPGGGDRVVASPSVSGAGDRVVASPSVNGGANRIPASPGVGAKGPRPADLGLSSDAVLAPPASNQGLNRAQAFATPSTAIAAGAAPPAHMRLAPTVENAPSFSGPSTRGPASPAFVAVVPGGSRGIASTSPSPNLAGRVSPSFQPPPVAQGPQSVARPPSFGAPPPSFHSSAPTVRSTPSFSTPPPPSFRSSAPTVRSTPSFRSPSPPSFRSSAPAVRSTPSFRSPSPPSFRSSAPAVRSTPSFGSSRSFSPSRSAAPSVRSSGGLRKK